MASPAAPTASSATPASRRRQRSTRLTVAVTLLLLGAVAVAAAVATGSWALTVGAAVLSVVLGAAATRITHSELVQSRRDAARDRAEQAQAYRVLSEERSAEHAAYVATVEQRIAEREASIAELESGLTAAQQWVADTTLKLGTEARRADAAERARTDLAADLDAAEGRAAEAIVRMAELEQEVEVLRAELEVVTGAWREAEAARKRA
ncbi:hypothetical protein [Nocardioides sp. SYSU DS0663]|uniref:hypothetical protein n=1 Tax=Nocardioides sp. SYSU DS0663 TaxID=3416445 RepID=UPI003F4C43F7